MSIRMALRSRLSATDISLHTPGAETERVRVHIDLDVGEARRFEALGQAVRIDDHHRVEDVHQAEERTASVSPESPLSPRRCCVIRIRMPGAVSMRTLYKRRGGAPGLPALCTVLHVAPLVRELIVEAVRTGQLRMRNRLHCAPADSRNDAESVGLRVGDV